MTIHREIGPSYRNKPIVQGVNYSPFMVYSKEEMLVKEERWLEAIPTADPPPIFLRQLAVASVSCISCFLHRLFQERLGDPLYNWFYVKTKRTTQKRMASEARGAKEHMWRSMTCWACCLQIVGPPGLYFSYFCRIEII
jgi:hypothetical protein